ncbi:MAG: hypothetical protein AAFN50_02845 [Pseudomonadota bacterium]
MSNNISKPAELSRAFARVAVCTVLLLLIPLIAMQFTSEVNWSRADFAIMGVLLFGFGSAFVLIARKVQRKRRLVVGVVLAVLFLWLWAELAVGVFTNWGS